MSEKTNKTKEETASAPQEQQYSQEEMDAMRVKMQKFYEEEMPFLELQEKYERLQADIEEHKVRRMTMMIRGAQMYAAGEAAERQSQEGAPGAPTETPTETPTEGRKLKKD